MSKKKIKKFSKAEILAELAKVSGAPAGQSPLGSASMAQNIEKQIENVATTKIKIPDRVVAPEIDEHTFNSKKDLGKIAMLFGGIVVIVVVVYILDLKTPIINNFANFLFKFLNLA